MNKFLEVVKNYWLSMLYEVTTLVGSFAIGSLIFGIPWNKALSIYLIYLIATLAFGNKMHYKRWWQCFIFSFWFIIGLCYLYSADMWLCYVLAIAFAFVLSHNADIRTTQLGYNENLKRPRKHLKQIDLVTSNKDHPKLIAYERYLLYKDERLQKVYNQIFQNRETISNVANLMELSTARVTEMADLVSIGIDVIFDIDK